MFFTEGIAFDLWPTPNNIGTLTNGVVSTFRTRVAPRLSSQPKWARNQSWSAQTRSLFLPREASFSSRSPVISSRSHLLKRVPPRKGIVLDLRIWKLAGSLWMQVVWYAYQITTNVGWHGNSLCSNIFTLWCLLFELFDPMFTICNCRIYIQNFMMNRWHRTFFMLRWGTYKASWKQEKMEERSRE